MNRRRNVWIWVVVVVICSLVLVVLSYAFVDEVSQLSEKTESKLVKGSVCIKESSKSIEFTDIVKPMTMYELIQLRDKDKTRTRDIKKCYTFDKFDDKIVSSSIVEVKSLSLD